jgi:hypothetical protein
MRTGQSSAFGRPRGRRLREMAERFEVPVPDDGAAVAQIRRVGCSVPVIPRTEHESTFPRSAGSAATPRRYLPGLTHELGWQEYAAPLRLCGRLRPGDPMAAVGCPAGRHPCSRQTQRGGVERRAVGLRRGAAARCHRTHPGRGGTETGSPDRPRSGQGQGSRPRPGTRARTDASLPVAGTGRSPGGGGSIVAITQTGSLRRAPIPCVAKPTERCTVPEIVEPSSCLGCRAISTSRRSRNRPYRLP